MCSGVGVSYGSIEQLFGKELAQRAIPYIN